MSCYDHHNWYIDKNQSEYVPETTPEEPINLKNVPIKSMIQHYRFRIIVAQLQLNIIDLLNIIDFVRRNLSLWCVAIWVAQNMAEKKRK